MLVSIKAGMCLGDEVVISEKKSLGKPLIELGFIHHFFDHHLRGDHFF